MPPLEAVLADLPASLISAATQPQHHNAGRSRHRVHARIIRMYSDKLYGYSLLVPAAVVTFIQIEKVAAASTDTRTPRRSTIVPGVGFATAPFFIVPSM